LNRLTGRIRSKLFGGRIRRAVVGDGSGPRALLMYSVAAFLPWTDPWRHQNVPQQRELAAALAERGYTVDAVNHDETRDGLLRARYDLVVDLHPRAQPLFRSHLNPGARRIAYITGSDPSFANAAEAARCADLEHRRGARVRPRRQTPPFDREVLGSCDAMFLIGGSATRATYDGYPLRMVRSLPNSGYDDQQATDAARRDPRRYLFLGSSGQVHKGLDLLLEVFRERPALELVVCSDFARERDFADAYRRELHDMPNVRAIGPMDLSSRAFLELQATCGAMVLPSCAEGQCGTVTIALGFGLPCLVSRECGLDDPELDTLADCRIETIARHVERCAARTNAEVGAQAAAARGVFDARYRPRHYAAAVRRALDEVLAVPAGRLP
jgi:hypothetical protein